MVVEPAAARAAAAALAALWGDVDGLFSELRENRQELSHSLRACQAAAEAATPRRARQESTPHPAATCRAAEQHKLVAKSGATGVAMLPFSAAGGAVMWQAATATNQAAAADRGPQLRARTVGTAPASSAPGGRRGGADGLRNNGAATRLGTRQIGVDFSGCSAPSATSLRRRGRPVPAPLLQAALGNGGLGATRPAGPPGVRGAGATGELHDIAESSHEGELGSGAASLSNSSSSAPSSASCGGLSGAVATNGDATGAERNQSQCDPDAAVGMSARDTQEYAAPALSGEAKPAWLNAGTVQWLKTDSLGEGSLGKGLVQSLGGKENSPAKGKTNRKGVEAVSLGSDSSDEDIEYGPEEPDAGRVASPNRQTGSPVTILDLEDDGLFLDVGPAPGDAEREFSFSPSPGSNSGSGAKRKQAADSSSTATFLHNPTKRLPPAAAQAAASVSHTASLYLASKTSGGGTSSGSSISTCASTPGCSSWDSDEECGGSHGSDDSGSFDVDADDEWANKLRQVEQELEEEELLREGVDHFVGRKLPAIPEGSEEEDAGGSNEVSPRREDGPEADRNSRAEIQAWSNICGNAITDAADFARSASSEAELVFASF